MNQKFKQATPILEKLILNQFEAYFVGGSVRDYLLGKDIHDVDIATSATPKEVMNIFPKNVPVGIEHGTVIVIENGINYEITTFRTESDYVDYRRPSEVQFVRSLEEDLKRRDFTINAMAMTVDGQIIDLFNGKQDLHNKIIRTVGNPNERFSEDALRMMRGLRFVSQLGFTLEEQTIVSIKQNAHLLENISIERITSEFEKLLMGEYLSICIPNTIQSNLINFLPKMDKVNGNFTYCINYDFTHLHQLEEKWALLLLVLEINDTIDYLKTWKLPRKRMLQIKKIIDGVNEIKIWDKYFIYKNGIQTSISIEAVKSIYNKKSTNFDLVNKLFDSLPIYQSADICINGRDLMEWCNRRSGKWISEYIERIEREIIDEKLINQKELVREAVMKWEK